MTVGVEQGPSGPRLCLSVGHGWPIFLAFMLAACGDGDQRLTVRDREGREVDTELVEVYRGEDHCGWQEVTFLRLGSPVTHDVGGEAHMYVRDPDGVLADQTVATYEPRTTLPSDARFTGYTSDAGQLWLPGDDEDLVAYFVSKVNREHVEAWPRAKRIVGCD